MFIMLTFLFESTTLRASTNDIFDFDAAFAPNKAITDIVKTEYRIAENNSEDINDFGISS